METMTTGQKAAATRRANLARLADTGMLATSEMGKSGMAFEIGKTCITCFIPQVAFPAAQLPNTSPRYPQCAECLAFEYRRIARMQAVRAS